MTRFRTPTGRGYGLAISYHPARAKGKPLCVVMHGLGVDSSYPMVRSLRTRLNREGYPVLTFDFAGHGASGGSLKDRTVTSFVRDLATALREGKRRGYTDGGVVLIGHSIGALVALIYAGTHRGITASIPIGCNAEASQKREKLLKRGKLREYARYLVIGRTKVAKNFWDDRVHYEPQVYARKLTQPVFFVCGSRDVTNPPDESRMLYQWAKHHQKKCSIIPGADHYYMPARHREILSKRIIIWLRNLQ